MPPMFVNVGAYVGEGTMIDSHALIGSCAQVGRNCHISAGSQIGGVLEPVGALPVIIEDEVLVGGNSGVYEGTVVKRRAVLGTGTILNRSIPVYERCRIPRAQNGDSRCKPRSSSSTATRRRKRACSSKTSCVSVSLRQHFFKKLQRSRIVGLPQPEHGLFSHGGIPIRLRHFDQFGHAFVLGQLA